MAERKLNAFTVTKGKLEIGNDLKAGIFFVEIRMEQSCKELKQ
ncbi:MAG: hypothetical protein ACR2FN_03155 [Chitinophagaceae bacterium]